MKKINFFIILCFSINLVFSQHNNFSNKSSSENNSYNWIVDYPDNIRLPFTNLEIQKLKYIYGDQLKKYVTISRKSINIFLKRSRNINKGYKK